MARAGTGAVRIIDDDNDVVGVTGNALDVHIKTGTSTIDIGDVSLLLGGTAASVNNGAADATTLRVTIASDTTGVLSIDDGGGSLTIDGTVTANLGTVDNDVLDVIASPIYAEDSAHTNADKGIFVLGVQNESDTVFGGADDYCPIAVDRFGSVGISERIGLGELLLKTEDVAHISGDSGIMSLAVRNDDYGTLGGADGDYSPLQVGALGALYVEQIVHSTTDSFATFDVDNAVEQLSSSDCINETLTDCAEIFLQADEDNDGYVIVGDSNVADNRGMKLLPGDTLILDVSDTSVVYLWGSAANQNMRCMAIRRAT